MKRFSLSLLVLLVVLFLSNVYVAAAAPTISMAIAEHEISPNGDGFKDATIVNFTLNERAKVTVRIRTLSGSVVTTIIQNWDRGADFHGFVWGGTRNLTNGGILSQGEYVMEITAVAGSGTGTTSERITVKRPTVSPGAIESEVISGDKIANGTIGWEKLNTIAQGRLTEKIVDNRGLVDNRDIKKGAINPNRIKGRAWTSRNDGANSGLDADKVDGRHYSDLAGDFVDDNSSEVGNADIANGALSAAKIAGTAWTGTNDGAGSGLDADLLDGFSSAAFAGSGHNHDAAYVNDDSNEVDNADIADGALSAAKIAGTAWTGTNDGAGSGLDADLLDGFSSAAFATAVHGHTQADVPFAIAGDASDQRIERGAVGPLATDGASTTSAVSFGASFSSAPSVYLTLKDVSDPTSVLYVAANNVDTAGFDALLSVVAPGGAGSTTEISWIAIGN